MTVIAWDGKTLAADKMNNSCGYANTVTKIWRTPDGMLVGGAGEGWLVNAVREWITDGMESSKYPPEMRLKENTTVIAITPAGKILKFEGGPTPEIIEDRFIALGAGRDYALAAMYLGHDAEAAVEVACHFEIHCGMGVDVLRLHDA